MYRWRGTELEVFIVHPGGPFFVGRDDGYWGIPKGEVEEGEELLEAALREFKEETGLTSSEPYISLGDVVQKSGKVVHAWAFKGDWTGLLMGSSYVTMEWPLRSGKTIKFAEIDKAGFFPLEVARKKMNQAQTAFLDRLVEAVKP